MATTNIYVLRLEGGNYYIGKSDDVMRRYQQHLNGNGSAWTRKYKPVALDKTYKSASPFDEDKITKEYMSKYGMDKVRGGSYVEVQLSDFQIDALKMELWNAKDLCSQCGRAGHFVKDCRAKTDASGNKIMYEQVRYEESSDDEELEWGCDYCDRTFTTEFGCGVHEKSCKSKTYQTKNRNSRTGGTCYRCGNEGHYSTTCYTSRHVDGYYLD
jgi:predicted GIY-YIG superfamily endonuclease